jgi:predicted nucleic acid-binding protein
VARVIVLDACVMIAHFDENDVHHGRAGRLLADLGVEPAIMSPLSRAEVLVAPARAGRRRAIEDAMDRIDIAVDDLPGNAAGQLAELRAHTGLKLPDCCVLLTAERHGPAEIATFDTRLARVAVERGLLVRPDA